MPEFIGHLPTNDGIQHWSIFWYTTSIYKTKPYTVCEKKKNNGEMEFTCLRVQTKTLTTNYIPVHFMNGGEGGRSAVGGIRLRGPTNDKNCIPGKLRLRTDANYCYYCSALRWRGLRLCGSTSDKLGRLCNKTLHVVSAVTIHWKTTHDKCDGEGLE